MESLIDKVNNSHGPENPSLQNIHDTASAASTAEGRVGGDGAECANQRGMYGGRIRV